MPLIENKYLKASQVVLYLYLPLFICLLVYWPGLVGPFVFDDIVNFQSLMRLDSHDTFNRIYQFVLSGNAGPLGRPISLLSFMINDNTWPSYPWSFKYTNMLIHMLNGVFIFIICLQITRITNTVGKHRFMFAGIATTIWLLHPMQTSTVLYVIQRMTQLSTLFTLAGIMCFLYGRHLLTQSRNIKQAYWIMSSGMIFFGLLAIFSKESGILIVLFIGTIEYSLLKNTAAPESYKTWRRIFVTLPIVALFTALLMKLPGFLAGYDVRDFSLYERLLTESRILCDYLYNIFIPRSGGSGLFHDDYLKSTGLLEPVQTILSVIAITTLIVTGFMIRKKQNIVSFAILWFFSAHVLESTFVPLELYFEHRNYLAILGPTILFASLTSQARVNRRVTIILAVVFVTLISFITFHNNKVWGNPVLVANVWAAENPNSIRAQQSASAVSVMTGDHKKARKYIADIYEKHPQEAALLLQLIQLDCSTNTLTEEQIDRAIQILPNTRYSHIVIPTIIKLYRQISEKTCNALTTDSLLNIIDTLINSKSFHDKPTLHALYYWKGQLYAEKRQLAAAMESLTTASKYGNAIDIPLQQAIWLSSAGLFDDALSYIQLAERMDNQPRNPLLRHVRKKDISNLKKLILEAKLKKAK